MQVVVLAHVLAIPEPADEIHEPLAGGMTGRAMKRVNHSVSRFSGSPRASEPAESNGRSLTFSQSPSYPFSSSSPLSGPCPARRPISPPCPMRMHARTGSRGQRAMAGRQRTNCWVASRKEKPLLAIPDKGNSICRFRGPHSCRSATPVAAKIGVRFCADTPCEAQPGCRSRLIFAAPDMAAEPVGWNCRRAGDCCAARRFSTMEAAIGRNRPARSTTP